MSKLRLRDKQFLGYALKASLNLGGVWMNDDHPGDPFICIAHRLRVWTITVSLNGSKFESEGPTEKKACIRFADKLILLRETIGILEKMARADKGE